MEVFVTKSNHFWRSLLALAALTVVGCTGLTRPPADMARNPNGTYSHAGGPGWWKQNRSRAELVVGKGFRVPGIEGYFDDQGVPIDQPVAPVSYEEPEDDTLLGAFAPEVTYAKLKSAIGQGPNMQAARSTLASAQRRYAREDFAAAAEQFLDAAAKAPGSEIEEQALFMAGEAYFFADDYSSANDTFGMLLKKYPGTNHLDRTIERLWAIGNYWRERAEKDPEWPITPNVFDGTRPRFDTLGRALKVYDSIRMSDPTGPWSDDALMATATSHFIRGRYEDADFHFELLRRDYPKSEHQFNAHILGLECKLRKYQGPEYDGTALEEAEALVKQIRMQFGSATDAAQRQRVDERAAQVARERALRDWRMGQYYEKGKHFASARFYYSRIVKNHPSSQLATASRTRLAKIVGEADTPPESMGWLINLFPESSERRRIASVPVQDTTQQ